MARTAEAHQVLNDAFADRSVSKTYLALVSGGPADDSGRIDVALVPARKGRMRPAQPGEAGSEASTRYRVIARYPARGAGQGAMGQGAAALVELEPLTGRQHQIRVHARSAGWPILGDRLYASQVVRARADRLMLHAKKLRFRHPESGAEVEFEAPTPRDFDVLCQRLASA
jgi:23S rRNA-/tRNA-specific pseudouridylate synthase